MWKWSRQPTGEARREYRANPCPKANGLADVLTIALATLKEAVRRKIVLAGLLLTVGFLILFGLGVWFAFQELKSEGPLDPSERAIFGGFLLSGGMWVLNFVAALLAILTAVGAVSAEVSNGTMAALAARPVPRWKILVGKALGLALMLAAFVALSTGAVTAIVYFIAGYVPANPIIPPLLILLAAVVMQSLALLGTTRLPTIANGILIFALFSVGLIGGIVEQLGSVIDNAAMVNIGIVSSLVIPSRAIFEMASARLISGIASPTPGGPAASPFALANPPSLLMAIYAVAYCFAAVALAIRSFSTRDL
ncbi:MAG: ABC transporter permease [Chloroflexi bacterium]|nr:ABC transporter permease [Chloroflexota bacterium]MCY3938588.1 ABC transporter permease [Chloroflexota bacterium]